LLFAATQGGSRPETGKWMSYVNGKISVYEVHCEHEHMTRPIPLAKIGRVLANEFKKQSKALK
jgi:thioesterase domain-containing protein